MEWVPIFASVIVVDFLQNMDAWEKDMVVKENDSSLKSIGRVTKLRWAVKYRLYKIRKAIPQKIAWLLPKSVVMWAYLRVGAHATTGKYGSVIVPEVSMMDALDRWSNDHNIK